MNEKESTYWLTDTFFIGRLNSTGALAAMILSMPFTTILMAIGNLFGVGGSTYISRLIGEKQEHLAKRVSAVTFYLSIAFGVILMLLSCIGMEFILPILGASGGEDAFYTRSYIEVFALASPVMISNFMFEQVVRSDGSSKESMFGTILSVVVNMILDPIFIFALRLGAKGAAIATVIGNACAVIYYIWHISLKSRDLSLRLSDCKMSRDILSNIFKVGVSAMLLDLFMIVYGLLFNHYAMRYGDVVVVGFGVSQKIVQIDELVSMGIYTGVVPLIATAYFSGNRKRFYEVLKKTVLYLAAYC